MHVTRIQPPQLPPHVAACLAGLARIGGRAWLVGGSVRDLLLGRAPRDFDVATDLAPAAVAAGFDEVDLRSARFGACVVRLLAHEVTVTTLHGFCQRVLREHAFDTMSTALAQRGDSWRTKLPAFRASELLG